MIVMLIEKYTHLILRRKMNKNEAPPFVQFEVEKAEKNGHNMGEVFISNYQFISFCKKCHAPLYFKHEVNNITKDVKRTVCGLTGSECKIL
jgi:hypothetical protein